MKYDICVKYFCVLLRDQLSSATDKQHNQDIETKMLCLCINYTFLTERKTTSFQKTVYSTL